MTPTPKHVRLSFQEALHLTRLHDDSNSNPSQSAVQRFISRQPAWKVGNDLPWDTVDSGTRTKSINLGKGAFGGVVYAQAPLAAARAVEEDDKDAEKTGSLGIHVSFRASIDWS